MLETSIDGAHGVLLSFQGASNIGLLEIDEAARLVQEAVSPQANVIFGCTIDDSLGDEIRITVIAAGFDSTNQVRRPARPAYAAPKIETIVPAAFVPAAAAEDVSTGATSPSYLTDSAASESTTSKSWFEDSAEPATDAATADASADTATRAIPVIDDVPQSEDGTFGDDLDIPDFLK
jgi:cell division protein FtsZ